MWIRAEPWASGGSGRAALGMGDVRCGCDGLGRAHPASSRRSITSAAANGSAILSGSLYGVELWVWGIWDLGIAALALFGGLSMLSNGRFGRVVGYVWGVVVMFQSLLIISVAPWYAFTAIALAGLVVAGLAPVLRRRDSVVR